MDMHMIHTHASSLKAHASMRYSAPRAGDHAMVCEEWRQRWKLPRNCCSLWATASSGDSMTHVTLSASSVPKLLLQGPSRKFSTCKQHTHIGHFLEPPPNFQDAWCWLSNTHLYTPNTRSNQVMALEIPWQWVSACSTVETLVPISCRGRMTLLVSSAGYLSVLPTLRASTGAPRPGRHWEGKAEKRHSSCPWTHQEREHRQQKSCCSEGQCQRRSR